MLRPQDCRIWVILAWPVGHAKSRDFWKFNTKVLNFERFWFLDFLMKSKGIKWDEDDLRSSNPISLLIVKAGVIYRFL